MAFQPTENIVSREIELSALEFAGIVRPGEAVMWGQGSAEPLPLTQALLAQRHAIGGFSVFLGATFSDTLQAEHADCIRFSAYCGTGGNRPLAKAGKLDILPCHYSELAGLIASGVMGVRQYRYGCVPSQPFGIDDSSFFVYGCCGCR